MCMSECDCEASIMRREGPIWSVAPWKKIIVFYTVVV